MNNDLVPLYTLVAEDAEQRRRDQQHLDTIYQSILTVLLGAQAYLAANSQFDNWSSVFATAGIGLFGLLFVYQWWRSAEFARLMSLERYKILGELENMGGFPAIYVREWNERDDKKYRRVGIGRLRLLLSLGLILIPVALAFVTFLAGLPQFHDIIHPLFPK
ncbi:MAG TPA: hypothetical protein VH349_07240 [Ktedonobacterales bacterium]|jgi:hypothetical protein